MGWYARAMRRLGHTTFFAKVGRRLAPPIDRFLHRVSGGRLHVAESFLPTLVLTTTGRRSGQLRSQPLAYVERDGTAYVVGTNWGGDSHPAWTWNLLDDPAARVERRGRAEDVRARLLTEEEREQVWPDFVAIWPAYDTYLDRIDREPRIFALEPAEASA